MEEEEKTTIGVLETFSLTRTLKLIFVHDSPTTVLLETLRVLDLSALVKLRVLLLRLELPRWTSDVWNWRQKEWSWKLDSSRLDIVSIA